MPCVLARFSEEICAALEGSTQAGARATRGADAGATVREHARVANSCDVHKSCAYIDLGA
jgi:hypothetical protein